MRIAVTGANGLIGAQVVRSAARQGHQVTAVVRPASDRRGLAGADAALAETELDDQATLANALAGAQALIHCAGLFSYAAAPGELAEANVAGTAALLKCARLLGVERVVVTSSSVTCGSSLLPETRSEVDRSAPDDSRPEYFASKLSQEETARHIGADIGLDVVIACPTAVVGGPDWRLTPSNALIVGYLLNPLRTTSPAGGCNVVSVRDVADAHVLLAEKGTPGERYLVGGENVTWQHFHELLSELTGGTGPRTFATHTSAYLAASALELAAKLTETTPLMTRAEAATMGQYYWYSSDKLARLGYQPRSARRALVEALGWLSTSPHVPRFARSTFRLDPSVLEARELTPRPLAD
ncbi:MULTISPECIES: NAD-dependent epimerase/dehydratase family protein [Amycolatopsis]|uniref:NAD-dependent epimerase/dehydratase family protein n=1 Tax=Amycolatopsis albidoflavus TaxID=102226 RepID=A0ABW5I7M0_9PSEU